MRNVLATSFAALALLLLTASLASAQVEVTVPPSSGAQRFEHFWKRCFGSGHALLGLRADWQLQLAEMREELGIERVRFHGIFDDDMSVVLDTPTGYQFFNVDQVYGPMIKMGVKPIVELSFMPQQLAKCAPGTCQTVMHYKGIVMPPANYSEWTQLVQAFATHLVSRFGIDEVRTWHFEVWNELWGMPYPTDYLQLYDASRLGLKAVDSRLQIGGPVTMQCQYIGEFVRDRAGQFDFVSTHLYPTDPNCTTPGNLGYGDIDCFAHTIQLARSKAPGDKPFFLTEYNAGLFNAELLYSSFAAAFIFRNVPQLHGVLDIWSYWTFTDIFEENGMHGAPFAGFNYGIQTNRGIKKPVYRAFQLLHGAGSKLLTSTVTYAGATPPVNATVTAFATAADSGVEDNAGPRVFVSNFAPEQFAIKAENVTITVSQAPCGTSATLYLIDAFHANAYASWQALGSPAYPDEVQLAQMQQASRVVGTPVTITSNSAAGTCSVTLNLLPYAAARVDFPRM